MFRIYRILFAAIAAGGLHGQITQVDLHYQGKNIDFSSTTATKPFKSGTTIPSVCAVGEMFFKTDGPPGANLYGCTSLNSWTLQQNTLPAVSGNSGKVMTTDGTSLMFNSLGGDISGPASGATVTQIQGRPVSSSAPGSGQALAWNSTTLRWEPSTITGGGGAATTSQLGDFTVTRTSPTVLTIGASCSASTPCAVRFGNLVYSFATGASVSISAGSGSAYVYISSSGALTVGHNLTVGCTGCAAQSGVSGFPSDSIPLWTWSATSATWDAAGGADRRALLSASPIASGAGVIVMCINGICSPSLDTSYALTHDAAISGSDLYCSDTSGNTTYYSCTPPHLWPGYTAGMCFMFRPNTSSTTTATLAVAGNTGPLARLNITQADGISNPGTLITANKFYQLCYDGTQFRMSPGDSIATNPSSLKIRAIPFAIGDPAGSVLTAATTTTDYITVPFACTIAAYNLLIDGGSITVKFWKVASGTAIPTAANSINTNGVGIASGTAIHSTTLSDFTTLAVAANDILAMNVTAVASAKFVNGVLECDQ